MKDLRTVQKDYLEGFIDFSFAGQRASDFGLVRVSDGSRLNLSLLPSIQDRTSPIPGGDGSYLFGSNFTNRQFSVKIAYDHLTEGNLIKMKQWLNPKKGGELIFGEQPYIAWDAKLTGQPQLTLIPFIEKEKGTKIRIYKGEGTLNFIAYSPCGHNPKGKKWVNDYDKDYPIGKEEWLAASGLINKGDYDNFVGSPLKAKVYNAGDTPTDFNLVFSLASGKKGSIKLTHSSDISFTRELALNNTTNEEVILRMNTKLHLLEGLDAERHMTGKVFNNLILGGDFFKIPPHYEHEIGDYVLSISGDIIPEKIEYGYYYL